MIDQLPYAQPQSAHVQAFEQVHEAGAFAQPHDLGATQPSPQADEQKPEVNKTIPAETMPADSNLRVDFFMAEIIP